MERMIVEGKEKKEYTERERDNVRLPFDWNDITGYNPTQLDPIQLHSIQSNNKQS
jgi:hypothetical protein